MNTIFSKTPLTYKNYLLAAYYRTIDSWQLKTILILAIALFILSLFFDFYLFLEGILIWLVVFLAIPALKYILAIYRYKYKEMEVFFSESGFGYKLGEYKLEIDKACVISIRILNDHIDVDTMSNGRKQRMLFMITQEDSKMIKEQLLKSEYQNLLKIK